MTAVRVHGWCLAGLLLGLLLAMGAAPGPVRGAPAKARPASLRPVRLGILQPRPHLCLADEPSQRDLRVLRLAFGVGRRPGRRLDWPWFYRHLPWPPKDPRGLVAQLDTQALWGQPRVRVLGAQPDLPGLGVDRLAAWRGWVLAHLPGATPSPMASLGAFEAPLAAQAPFFASRLAGSRLLPFTLGDSARQPLDLCRRWPQGVTWLPGDDVTTYRLRNDNPAAGGPLRLTGYRREGVLWRDYFRGRLDALLLQGPDFDGQLGRYRASQLGLWGTVLGTQQIVLRLRPDVARTLGPDGRLALSLALPRAQLAQVDGPGRFAGAASFLGPVQAAGVLKPASELAWNTLQARRLWLQRERKLPRLRMAVLDDPVLQRLATLMQAQWLKTLNLSVRVQVLPVDEFARQSGAPAADFRLDVVDLDDGSLQDLWRQALDALHAPLGGTPQQWEAALRGALPFLPLLDNVHPVLVRPGAPAGLLQRVCPGCVPASSPRHLAPEPRAPAVNPEG